MYSCVRRRPSVHSGSVLSVQAHHLLDITVHTQRTQQIFCSKVCRIYFNSTIIKKKQQLQNYVQVSYFFLKYLWHVSGTSFSLAPCSVSVMLLQVQCFSSSLLQLIWRSWTRRRLSSPHHKASRWPRVM